MRIKLFLLTLFVLLHIISRGQSVTAFDSTPPRVKSAIPLNNNDLQIIFNEKIDTLAIKTNLFFVNGIGYSQSIKINKNAQQITLHFQEGFRYGQIYTLQIKEIIDTGGNASENIVLTFGMPELIEANDIVINEILFNPTPDCVDYVELYNRSKKVFDLASVFIATRDTKRELKSVYALSKQSLLLEPKQFVVITTNPDAVTESYTVKNPNAFLKIPKMPSFPNKKGIVLLLNQESEIIDELQYNEKMHLPLLFTKKGVALERMNYDLLTSSLSNWHSASETSGYGTPTYQNSTFSTAENVDNRVHISPKVFSPNGDGIDDFMQLHYKFNHSNYIAQISIFDSNGHLIRHLHNNLTLDTQGIIKWNGTDASNKRVQTGRYIILMEVFNTNGTTEFYKKSCVVHYRFK